MNFVRRHQKLIIVVAMAALIMYAFVVAVSSRETASTIGVIYLVVLTTFSVVWDLAHKKGKL